MISPQKKSQNPGTSKDRPGPKTPLGSGAQAPRGARVLILKCTPTYSANFQAPRGARKPPDECGRMHTTSMPVLIYIITLLSSLILMQCGDINPNPGPRTPKYPCGMCKRAVTRSCKAIMCDNCNIWIHNSCSGITDSKYESHQLDSKLSFICPSCEMPTYLQLIDSQIYQSHNVFTILQDTTRESSTPNSQSPICFQPTPFAMSTPDRSKSRNPKEAMKGFKIMSINCNCIIGLGKRAEFQSLIDEHRPHVVLGQESKLGPEHKDSEIFPQKYTVY